MKRMCLMLVFLCCAPALLFAQSEKFTGTWRVESTLPWEVVLREDGFGVTGRVSQCTSQVSSEIYDGGIDGNVVTFKCKSADGDRTVLLTGTLNGNEIAFDWSLQVRPGGAAVDPLPRGRLGILGPSSPPRFTARRVPDGALAAQADRLPGVELVAGVNLIQRDIKGTGALFLPEHIGRVRGVIVVIGWGRGFEAYADAALRKLAQTLNLGLMRASIYHVTEPNASLIGAGRIPAAEGTEALVLLMRRFAEESGHQELAAAPLLFWGHSAAGGLISRLAAMLPQRTIGFVRYHSGPQASGDMKVLSRIPALLMIGALDPGNSVEAATLWRSGRSARAPWTFAVEPNATHDDVNELRKANDLLIPWITAVVRHRLPSEGTTLRAVSDDSAWLGNNKTGQISPYEAFTESKLEASWLPDEATARAWRVVIGAIK